MTASRMCSMIQYDDGFEDQERLDNEAQTELDAAGSDLDVDEVNDLIDTFAQNHELSREQVPETLLYALNAAMQRERGDGLVDACQTATKSFTEATREFKAACARTRMMCHEELDVLDTTGPGGIEG